MSKITYDTKVYINDDPSIPDANKVTDDDMNEIKTAVNDNADKLTGDAVAGEMIVDSIETKNMFNKYSIVAGDITKYQPTVRLSSRQEIWLEAGTYTISCENIVSPIRYAVLVQNTGIPPLGSYPTYILDSGWKTSTSYTFTIATAGWCTIVFSKENNATLTVDDVIGLNWQLEKGSSATSYTSYQNLDEKDSGWQIATLTTNFNVYNSDSKNTPRYRKIGNMVNIRGIVTPTTSLASNVDQTIFTLPNGYIPSMEVRMICQGSGANRWLCSVLGDGKVAASRYGTTSMDNMTSGTWLPFNITYFID